MDRLDMHFEQVPYHKNERFDKSDMPRLPDGFRPHIGDFRSGSHGQYRRGQLHAYDMGEYWLIHKDRFDPDTHPVEHVMHDTENSKWAFFYLLADGRYSDLD